MIAGHDSGASPPPALGRVVWFDLMSTEPARAQAFYGALFGWHAQEDPEGRYVLLRQGGPEGAQVGGIVELDRHRPLASHWMPYILVRDVDASCLAATELGGRVAVPAMGVDGILRFAVLVDGQGVAFSLIQFAHARPTAADPFTVGQFGPCELFSPDPTAALGFYGPLFGWDAATDTPAETADPGAIVARLGDRTCAGLRLPPSDGPGGSLGPQWLGSVVVADLDETLRRLPDLGGRVLVPDLPVVGARGRRAIILDPTEAPLGLFQPAAEDGSLG